MRTPSTAFFRSRKQCTIYVMIGQGLFYINEYEISLHSKPTIIVFSRLK